MTSCLGGDNFEDNFIPTDAEIVAFSLSHDSVSELKTVVFSIDQKQNLIYNYDSMTYLTDIKEKVIINYTTAAGVNNILNITNGDSVWVNSGDSIDISVPLKLKVFALDGNTTKEYSAQLNIHQIDPDSVQYQKFASDLPFLQTEETKTILFGGRFFTFSKIENDLQLYSSSDAINWQKETLSGLPATILIKGIQQNKDQIFAYSQEGNLYTSQDANADTWRQVNTEYPVVGILGFLNASANQLEGLSVVVEKEGEKVFAFTHNSTDWTYSSSAIPTDFPLHDFSSLSYTVMKTERITNIGGVSSDGTVQNAVWSTQTGLYWAKISDNRQIFPPLAGANAFYYNDEFWLTNGQLSDGTYNKEVYYSTDGGNTWFIKPEKYQTPEDFTARSSASLVVDGEGKYFYIIGGKNSTVLPEIWKAFQNKKEFNY
ncbi:hypothetical protein FACS189426_16980 [Bacteroidia bacterium]|nr:hypothetical protein FACS189426_16980 [Bacteroidia bacterium]